MSLLRIQAARFLLSRGRMLDLILVGATAAFFGLAWGYVHITERL